MTPCEPRTEKISVHNHYEEENYDTYEEDGYYDDYVYEDEAAYYEDEAAYYEEEEDSYVQYGDPSIIYYDEIEALEEEPFWTLRRVVIAIIVVIMIVAFLAQLALPIIQSTGAAGGPIVPSGPTPTALPMI